MQVTIILPAISIRTAGRRRILDDVIELHSATSTVVVSQLRLNFSAPEACHVIITAAAEAVSASLTHCRLHDCLQTLSNYQ